MTTPKFGLQWSVAPSRLLGQIKTHDSPRRVLLPALHPQNPCHLPRSGSAAGFGVFVAVYGLIIGAVRAKHAQLAAEPVR